MPNPIMEYWFSDRGVTLPQRASIECPTLSDRAGIFVRYLHTEMWSVFRNGHDHAAIVTACALLEFALKDAVHFEAYLKADQMFDRALWDKIDRMTFDTVVKYGKKRNVLSEEQERLFLRFKDDVRNKWMHGGTPPVAKAGQLRQVLKADLSTGEVEMVAVDLSEEIMFQRMARVAVDRDFGPKVVNFVDESVRRLDASSSEKFEKFLNSASNKPPTREQFDRVWENACEKFGREAVEKMHMFGAHVPPAAHSDDDVSPADLFGSKGKSAHIDIREHDLSSIFTDAIGLFHLGRKHSALLLMLCSIDGLVTRTYPEVPRVRDRFVRYLKERLPLYTRVQNFHIHIPKTGEVLRLEEVIYRFLRNPIIHESASLRMDDRAEFAVQIDWADGAHYVSVDTDKNVVVLRGELVIGSLNKVIERALMDDLTKSASEV